MYSTQIKEARKVRLFFKKIIECIYLERTIFFIFKKNKFDQFFLEGEGAGQILSKILWASLSSSYGC